MRVLVEEVGDFGLVGVVVDKGHNSLTADDDFPEGRPLLTSLGHILRLVEEGENFRVLEGFPVIQSCHAVWPAGVADENSHDIVRVAFYPVGDFIKNRGVGAYIQQVTARVARIHSPVDQMRLALD